MKPYRKWVNLFKTVLAIVVGTCSWKERANAVPRVPLECKARLRIQAWLGANATPEGGGRVWSYPYRHCGRQETVQLLNHCHWGARTGFFTAVGYWVPPRQCTKPRASGSETIQTATSNDCTESLQCNGHMDESDLFGWFKVSPPAKRVSADINRTSSFCKKLSIATPGLRLGVSECDTQSSAIYQGLRGVYDYGAIGTKVLDNLRTILKAYFTETPHGGILRLSPENDDGRCAYGDFLNELTEGMSCDHEGYTGTKKSSLRGSPKSHLVADTPAYSSSLRDSVHLVETASLGPSALWKASGHLDKFSDDVVRCADTSETFRVDSLEYKSNGGSPPEYSIRFCEDGRKSGEWVANNRVGGSAESIWQPLKGAPLSVYPHLPSPVTGKCGSLLPPRQCSLMLHTNMANFKAKADEGVGLPKLHYAAYPDQRISTRDVAYLRPETAQNIFVSYLELIPASWRSKLPFGVAQEGRSYRNESQTARTSFILRMREFRQFEIEYFVHPSSDRGILMDQWKNHLLTFFKAVGIPSDCLTVAETHRDDLPHYAEASMDFVYNMKWSAKPGGTLTESPKEICGLAFRGCFDLTKHQKATGKDLKVPDTRNSVHGSTVLPHVVEASIGVDRLLFVLLHCAMSRGDINGRERFFLNLHPALAPFKVAVLPVVSNNHEIVAFALKSYRWLREKFSALWDESGSIGKRYRKADEMGVPFCISIDSESLRSQSVQIRWRNTGEQRKVRLALLPHFLSKRLLVEIPAQR